MLDLYALSLGQWDRTRNNLPGRGLPIEAVRLQPVIFLIQLFADQKDHKLLELAEVLHA